MGNRLDTDYLYNLPDEALEFPEETPAEIVHRKRVYSTRQFMFSSGGNAPSFKEMASFLPQNALTESEYQYILDNLDVEYPDYHDVLKEYHCAYILSLEADRNAVKKYFDRYIKKDMQKRAISRAIMDAYHYGTAYEREKAGEMMNVMLKGFVGRLILRNNGGIAGQHYQDLQAEGAVAITEGMASYDPERSLPTTFFGVRIQHRVTKYMNDNCLHISNSHLASLVGRVKRAIDGLTKDGIDITDLSITARVNQDGKSKTEVTTEQVRRAISALRAANYSYLSEAQADDRTDLEANQSMQDSSVDKSPEQMLLNQELSNTIRKVFEGVDETIMSVILQVNGFQYLNGELIEIKPVSRTEIAKHLSKETGKSYTSRSIATMYTSGVSQLRNNPALRSWSKMAAKRYGKGKFSDDILFSVIPDTDTYLIGAELDPNPSDFGYVPYATAEASDDVLFKL